MCAYHFYSEGESRKLGVLLASLMLMCLWWQEEPRADEAAGESVSFLFITVSPV